MLDAGRMNHSLKKALFNDEDVTFLITRADDAGNVGGTNKHASFDIALSHCNENVSRMKIRRVRLLAQVCSKSRSTEILLF